MTRARPSIGAAVVAVAVLAGAGCTDKGGVNGIVGAPLPDPAAPGGPTTTTGNPTPSSPGAPGPTVVLPTVPPSTAPGPGPSPAPTVTAPAPAPGGLRLGGDDLGVTRVGAPFREAVAAVSGALGRPVGDPAPDTSCIGAEDETSWESFRLASNGGRVSGWLSTSTTLATPDGVTVGTPLAAVRQVYGARLQVRPPPEPDNPPVFVVDGAGLGGTLTGQGPTGTVASIFNGTCESA